jgi:Cu+-exporting ATPase
LIQINVSPMVMFSTCSAKTVGSAMDYICSMHSDVRQAGPGKCPRCGMALLPEGTLRPASTHGQQPAASFHHDSAHAGGDGRRNDVDAVTTSSEYSLPDRIIGRISLRLQPEV